MKILFAACLFLCLVAVYGQAGNSTREYSVIPRGSRFVPNTGCQRSPTLWQRAYFSRLYTNTNGVRKYYFQCSLYWVRQTGCRESGRGCGSSYVTYTSNPLRTSSSCRCCKATSVLTVRPTMYCRYVFTVSFRTCPRPIWNLQMNVRVRDHPITRRYTYRYVRGCSCQNCVGRFSWFSRVAGREQAEEEAGITDYTDIPEFNADRNTQAKSNPSAQERATAFRLIPSQERSAVCGASPGDSRIRDSGPGDSRIRDSGPGDSRIRDSGPGDSRIRDSGPGDFRIRDSIRGPQP